MASAQRSKFTWTNYLIRLMFALVLVFATYNPSGWSYVHWVRAHGELDAYVALAGVVLLIGWAIFLRATVRSLGVIGTTLAVAFFALLIWLVVDLFDIRLLRVSPMKNDPIANR